MKKTLLLLTVILITALSGCRSPKNQLKDIQDYKVDYDLELTLESEVDGEKTTFKVDCEFTGETFVCENEDGDISEGNIDGANVIVEAMFYYYIDPDTLSREDGEYVLDSDGIRAFAKNLLKDQDQDYANMTGSELDEAIDQMEEIFKSITISMDGGDINTITVDYDYYSQITFIYKFTFE